MRDTVASRTPIHPILLTEYGGWRPELIESLLRIHKGRMSEVAAALGVDRSSIKNFVNRNPELEPLVDRSLGPHSGDETHTAILKAIAKTHGGTALEISKATGLSRSLISERLRTSPALKRAQMEAREQLTDQAEMHHAAGVIAGEDKHVFFQLKTRGKDRGYREGREDITHTRHTHTLDKTSTADLVAQIKAAREQQELPSHTPVETDFEVLDNE